MKRLVSATFSGLLWICISCSQANGLESDSGSASTNQNSVDQSTEYKIPRSANYRQVTNFDRPNRGRINISSFAYRDLNHNGNYDLDEQSMYGVRFLLIDTADKDQSETVVQTTNKAGFANFPMSATREDANISAPGTYRFVAVPPPGTEVSSGNRIQEFSVSSMPGSIGDLVLDTMPRPVGFKPKLTVSGAIEPGDNAKIELQRGAVSQKVSTDSKGSFSIPMETRDARPFEVYRGNESLSRVIEDTCCPVVLSRISDISRQNELANSKRAQSKAVATFEELVPTSEVRKIPNGYVGLNWDNMTAIHSKFSNGIGYHNVVNSGHFAAYNSSGLMGAVYNDTPFDFLGGYFTVGHANRHGEIAILRGYVGDELIYEDHFPLSAYFATYFQAEYLQITKLTMHTKRFWQIAMDDLIFRL